jgi:hypothetical protein
MRNRSDQDKQDSTGSSPQDPDSWIGRRSPQYGEALNLVSAEAKQELINGTGLMTMGIMPEENLSIADPL